MYSSMTSREKSVRWRALVYRSPIGRIWSSVSRKSSGTCAKRSGPSPQLKCAPAPAQQRLHGDVYAGRAVAHPQCTACAISDAAGSKGLHGTRLQPYRVFFLLAASDAIIAVGLWLPKLLGLSTGNVAGVPLAVWHRDELLYGMMPAVLAGFVLTALPRWTRQSSVGQPTLMVLAALWLAGRVAHVAAGESLYAQAWAQGMALVFALTLTLLAARQIITSRAWREFKIVLLLAGFAVATGLAILHLEGGANETPMRLGLACVLGLVVVLGGRITPALTVAWLEARGEQPASPRRERIETFAALAVAVALCAWVVAPTAGITAVASACACIVQAERLIRWRGWRVADSASILALHAAYGWIPVGFAIHAAAVFYPSFVSEAAAVHAWALGAIGLMSVAVMASMIRRHSHMPFAYSALASASLACAAIAAPARIVAEIPSDWRIFWLLVSAASWVAAFLLLLLAFKDPLLRHRRCRPARRGRSI